MNLIKSEKTFVLQALQEVINNCNDQIGNAQTALRFALSMEVERDCLKNIRFYEKEKKIAYKIIKKIRDDLKTE